MNSYLKIALIYLAAISIFSVIICIFDKLSAKRGGRRIRERMLMLLSILGGSLAMYITMRLIHHKTLHRKFMIGIPIIILFQAAIILLIFINNA